MEESLPPPVGLAKTLLWKDSKHTEEGFWGVHRASCLPRCQSYGMWETSPIHKDSTQLPTGCKGSIVNALGYTPQDSLSVFCPYPTCLEALWLHEEDRQHNIMKGVKRNMREIPRNHICAPTSKQKTDETVLKHSNQTGPKIMYKFRKFQYCFLSKKNLGNKNILKGCWWGGCCCLCIRALAGCMNGMRGDPRNTPLSGVAPDN